MNKVLYSGDAREKLVSGINQVADAVSTTLGPKGRNVIFSNDGVHDITKDGVTVAKNIHLEDKLENVGASVIKEVSSRTADEAGDGTTTATVIARKIINEANDLYKEGIINPILFKRALDKYLKKVTTWVKQRSTEINEPREIRSVATISANNDEFIGNLIADAFEQVGKDGVISVEESQTYQTTLETVEGMEIGRGYLSPYFITDAQKQIAEYEDAFVLLYKGSIGSINTLVPLLEDIMTNGEGKPLVIVADSVEGDALQSLVINKLQGHLKTLVIKAPSFGAQKMEIMSDLAILLNTEVVDPDIGHKLEDVTTENLGFVDKVKSDNSKTVFITKNPDQERLDDRLEFLKNKLEDKTLADHERVVIHERLAKLTGGVAVIYLGAMSDIELKEKKYRVEDALHATRSALDQGIVAGGGLTLYKASLALGVDDFTTNDEKYALQIMKLALRSPLHAILNNSGLVFDEVYSVDDNSLHDMESNVGYNCLTDKFEDLMESGVIDPTKVTLSALTNAVSVSSTILTTEVLIFNETEKEEE